MKEMWMPLRLFKTSNCHHALVETRHRSISGLTTGTWFFFFFHFWSHLFQKMPLRIIGYQFSEIQRLNSFCVSFCTFHFFCPCVTFCNTYSKNRTTKWLRKRKCKTWRTLKLPGKLLEEDYRSDRIIQSSEVFFVFFTPYNGHLPVGGQVRHFIPWIFL